MCDKIVLNAYLRHTYIESYIVKLSTSLPVDAIRISICKVGSLDERIYFCNDIFYLVRVSPYLSISQCVLYDFKR